MNSDKIKFYFSAEYLFSPVSGTKYELFYLTAPLVILGVTLAFRIFLFFKKGRPEAYRTFDKLWFWGGISLGLSGLFIYFARTQGLPIFSMRLVSYAWILLLLGYTGYLVYYYRKHIPTRLRDYYHQKRKSKYLKR